MPLLSVATDALNNSNENNCDVNNGGEQSSLHRFHSAGDHDSDSSGRSDIDNDIKGKHESDPDDPIMALLKKEKTLCKQ